MLNLIEQLRKTPGPKRRLDYQIGQRLWNCETYRISDEGDIESYDDGEANEYAISGWFPIPQEVSLYTESIDAAIVVIPKGWRLQLFQRKPGWRSRLIRYSDYTVVAPFEDDVLPTEAPNAAIAICIAALIARSIEDKFTGGG